MTRVWWRRSGWRRSRRTARVRAGWRRWGVCWARGPPADDVERTCWAIDGHDNVVAEISAELHISRGRARGQLRYAIHLREKLPRLMGVFLAGVIDMRMVIAIVNRVVLVTDAQVMARL